MADILPRRINIQQEETQYRAAVSEATLSRVGAATNFINMKQYDSRGFFVNGPYGSAAPVTGVDGAWGILFDIEIVGVMMFNLVAGAFATTTTLDIIRHTAVGSSGSSIFSTKPSINGSCPSNSYILVDVLNNTVVKAPVLGVSIPVLNTVNLNAGDMLTMNIDSAMTAAQNCGILIYYRPR